MSMHSLPKINQKEYLKKYLSGDKVKKKKKDKKHKKSSTNSVKVKIIDDDINHLDVGLQIDEDLLLAGDDAPQIVGEYIEENPSDTKVPKWKSIVIKDEPDDNCSVGNNHNETEVWGKKANEVRVKQEFSFGKKHSNRTPDNSPPRRNERKRKSSSPPRKRRKSPSPLRKSTSHKIKTEPQSPLYPKRYHGDSNGSLDTSPLRNRNNDQSPTRRHESTYRNEQKKFSEVSPNDRSRNRHQSPPRKVESSSRNNKNHSSQELSTRHRRDSDQSPPRRDKNRDQSPPRRRKNAHQSPSEKTKSPMRNFRKKSPSLSPKRRRRRDSDQSPPRRNRRSDNSPTRHKRDSDLSPPRKSQGRRDSDQLPPRKIRNSFDESPPRKSRSSSYRKGRETPDHCPSGKNSRSPNHSLPERKRKSAINYSPNRIKREKQTPDLSPQRRQSRWEKQESEKSVSPPPTHKAKPVKTLDGKKAGLQDAKSLQEETLRRRKQEDLLFEKMPTKVSGRNAEIQVRSTGRKGRRAREAYEEDPEERRRKEEHEEKKKLLYDRWGKGLKQLEDHKNRMLEHEHESNKPLARYSNDEDLERHLKERERADDPMLQYMRQKRKDNEKLSGKPQIPRYEGAYPENRFSIRPGYRWDGVDRSNGFEKKYFAAQNEEHARQDEAYKYSVEDM